MRSWPRSITLLLPQMPSTVKTHLRSIYRKMGVTNRAQAVASAIRRGIWTGAPFAPAMPGAGAVQGSANEGSEAIVEAPTRG